MAGATDKKVVSTAFGRVLSRVLDSMEMDKISWTDCQTQQGALESNVRIIESYGDALILDDIDICSGWYMDLQDAMYAAIDVLDVCAISAEKASILERKESIMDGLKVRLLNILNTVSIHAADAHSSLSLALTVKLINDRIENLLEQGKRQGHQGRIESRLKKFPKLRPEFKQRRFGDLPIIGREKEKDEIIKWLKAGHTGEASMRLQILPIVGMGGIGKTTLAQSIYTSERHGFDLYGWIDCSSETDTGLLLTTILSQFKMKISTETSDDDDSDKLSDNDEYIIEVSNIEKLSTWVMNVVKRKRILLIIDDVWSMKKLQWEPLLNSLMCGEAKSRLIITTRDMEDVEKIVRYNTQMVAPALKLEGLDGEDLWSILKDYTYGTVDRFCMPPKDVETIGKEIVRKLQSLPLAAKAVGCLMGPNRSAREWKDTLESDLWNILETQHDVKSVPALIFSFLNLWPEAKSCFKYCSVLDMAGSSSVRELVYQWSAHDYLQLEDNQSVEDAGAHMINYLEDMSLLTKTTFWDVSNSRFATVVQMNNLIQDMARAWGRHDHLWISDDGDCEIQLKEKRPRHICMCVSQETSLDTLQTIRSCTKLRTLTLSGRLRGFTLCHVLGYMLKELKSLRVLTLSGLGTMHLPKEIGELKQLRYLDLSYNHIHYFPDPIGELHQLQVLILRGTSSSYPLSSELLRKLSRLRYLDLSDQAYHMRKLPQAVTSLSDLRVLLLTCSGLQELPEEISNLQRLECLELNSCPIMELPENLTSLHRLQVLSIQKCKVLDRLPSNFSNLLNLSCFYLDMKLLYTLSGIGNLSLLESLEEFCVQDKQGHRIDELANLNMLCGKLKIRDLQAVKSKAEAQKCRLDQKIHLKELELHWTSSDGTRDDIIEEAIMESLKPTAATLTGLTIRNYIGKSLPSWFNSQHLYLLQNLCLSGLQKIRAIEYSEGSHAEYFPHLRVIRISNCPELESMPVLPLSLKNLYVYHVGFSEFPSLERQLPNLQQLIINKCEKLRYPPRNGFKHLESLEALKLKDCPWLPKLSQNSNYAALPVHLRRLEIVNCPSLETESVKMSLEGVMCLRYLHLDVCCRSMPKSLVKCAVVRHLKTIRSCTINFGGLTLDMDIPDDTFESLQRDSQNDTDREIEDNAHPEREARLSRLELAGVIFASIPYTPIKNLLLRGFRSYWPAPYECIIFCEDLESLPANVSRLSTLKRLFIDSLVCFSPEDEGWSRVEQGKAFFGLNSVKHVKISNCSALRSVPYSFFLLSLQIKDCHGIRDLYCLGGQMPYLRFLLISGCKNLRNSPKHGFTKLISLKGITLRDCPMLSNLSLEEEPGDLPPSLEELIIEDCIQLQMEHITRRISQLTLLKILILWNCGGWISKFIVTQVVNLFVQKTNPSFTFISNELVFEWYSLYKRSIVSWKVISNEKDGAVDMWNSLEFFLEMLEAICAHNTGKNRVEELNISGIYDLEVIQGRFKEVLLRLTSLSRLKIANCPNLSSLPLQDLECWLPNLNTLSIESLVKLPDLDPSQVTYEIIRKEQLHDRKNYEQEEDSLVSCKLEQHWDEYMTKRDEYDKWGDEIQEQEEEIEEDHMELEEDLLESAMHFQAVEEEKRQGENMVEYDKDKHMSLKDQQQRAISSIEGAKGKDDSDQPIKLDIIGVHEFEEMKSKLEVALLNLNYLQELTIKNCGESPCSLPVADMKTTHLRYLEITNCRGLEIDSLRKYLQSLTSIRSLKLENCCPGMSNSFLKDFVAPCLKIIERCEIRFDDMQFYMLFEKGTVACFHWDYYNAEGSEDTLLHDKGDSCSRRDFLECILQSIRSIESSQVKELFISEARHLILTNDILGKKIAEFIMENDKLKSSQEGMISLYQGEQALDKLAVDQRTRTHTIAIEGCQNITSLYKSILKYRLPFIQKLIIKNCVNLESLPRKGFTMMENLEYLTLTSCGKLRKLSLEGGSAMPPNLRELFICHCPSLEIDYNDKSLQDSLNSLQRLEIKNCKDHVSYSFVKKVLSHVKLNLSHCEISSTMFILLCDKVDDDVKVDEVGAEENKQYNLSIEWLKENKEDIGDSCSCHDLLAEMLDQIPYRCIRKLKIGGLHELEEIKDKLKELLPKLSCLEEFIIVNCKNLSCLPVADILAPHLQALEIAKCGRLEPGSLSVALKALTSLRKLKLENCCHGVSNFFVKKLVAHHLEMVKKCEKGTKDVKDVMAHHLEIRFDDLQLYMLIEKGTKACFYWDYKDFNINLSVYHSDYLNEMNKNQGNTNAEKEEKWSRIEMLIHILDNLAYYGINNLFISEARQLILLNDIVSESISDFVMNNNKLICTPTCLSLYQSQQPLYEFQVNFVDGTPNTFVIEGCENVTSLTLDNQFPLLQQLSIRNCVNLEVPTRGGFTELESLEILTLECCAKLRKLSLEDCNILPSSLKELVISDCKLLEIESIEKSLHVPLTSLQRLVLRNSPRSVSNSFIKKVLAPFLKCLSECNILTDETVFQLYWRKSDKVAVAGIAWDCNFDYNQEDLTSQIKATKEDATSDDCTREDVLKEILEKMPSSNLQKLFIAGIHEVVKIEGELEKLLISLTSLKSLTIMYWKKLSLLPENMSNLSSLETLNMISCHNFSTPDLVMMDDKQGKSILQLETLKHVVLSDCKRVRSLMIDGRYFSSSSLETLEIRNCEGIRDLSMLSYLMPQLQKLIISDCVNLEHLDFGAFTSLQSLIMTNCLKLSELALEDNYSLTSSLSELVIDKCKGFNVRYFECYLPTFTSLQKLVIRSCGRRVSIPL